MEIKCSSQAFIKAFLSSCRHFHRIAVLPSAIASILSLSICSFPRNDLDVPTFSYCARLLRSPPHSHERDDEGGGFCECSAETADVWGGVRVLGGCLRLAVGLARRLNVVSEQLGPRNRVMPFQPTPCRRVDAGAAGVGSGRALWSTRFDSWDRCRSACCVHPTGPGRR